MKKHKHTVRHTAKPAGIVVGAKISEELLAVIDEEVAMTGYSRSDIIRRTLLDAFRHKLQPQVPLFAEAGVSSHVK